jgi:hypothetical protein
MTHRILIKAALALAIGLASGLVDAAEAVAADGLRNALVRAHGLLDDLHKGRIERRDIAVVDVAAVADSTEAKGVAPKRAPLTGTWRVHVPGPTAAESFDALQTFGSDGTFVETSSLLATLSEGPAHGVWTTNRAEPLLTFELFAFDENGTAIGHIRVRNRIRVVGQNEFTASSVVDILPFGEPPILAVGGGDYSAERVVVRTLD